MLTIRWLARSGWKMLVIATLNKKLDGKKEGRQRRYPVSSGPISQLTRRPQLRGLSEWLMELNLYSHSKCRCHHYGSNTLTKNRIMKGFASFLTCLTRSMIMAFLWIVTEKQAITRENNVEVKKRFFQVGDLVLRKAEFTAAERRDVMLGANYEGPYRVIKVLSPRTYQL